MAEEEGVLTCPECGRTFTRPQALGAHRQRAHGVAGKSSRTQSRRTRRQPQRQPQRQSRPERPERPERQPQPPAGAVALNGRVNRDALLQALFPEGMPPREEVLQRAKDWLDEAERLVMPVRR